MYLQKKKVKQSCNFNLLFPDFKAPRVNDAKIHLLVIYATLISFVPYISSYSTSLLLLSLPYIWEMMEIQLKVASKLRIQVRLDRLG